MTDELNLPLPEPRRPEGQDPREPARKDDSPSRRIEPPGTQRRHPGAGGLDQPPVAPPARQELA